MSESPEINDLEDSAQKALKVQVEQTLDHVIYKEYATAIDFYDDPVIILQEVDRVDRPNSSYVYTNYTSNEQEIFIVGDIVAAYPVQTVAAHFDIDIE